MQTVDERVKKDQTLTHVVELVDVCVSDGGDAIAQALRIIGERAVAAGMMVLSTTISTNTYIANEELGVMKPHLVVAIICHWQKRALLESMQRQNALMGQPGHRRMS